MKITNKLPILKEKPFAKLWRSHLLSQLSSYMLIFLVISKTFEVTTSNVATGMIWITSILPTLFFSPFSGSLVDIWNKRTTLRLTYIFHALTIIIFAIIFSQHNYYLAYPLLFLYAAISTVNDPAELATIPLVTKKNDQLLSANNLIFLTDQFSLIISSAVVSILVKFIPIPVVILLIALMPVIASFNIASMENIEKPRKTSLTVFNEVDKLIEKVKSGYKFIKENRLILYGFFILISFRILISVSILLLPSISKEIMSLSPYDAGYAIVLPMALGLIIGTAILNKKESRKTRKMEWISIGLTLLGINLILFSWLTAGFSNFLILKRIVGILCSAAVGICVSVIYTPSQTFIHEFTPEEIRGHTFSTLTFFTTLISIPSILFITTLAEILGIKIFLTLVSLAILLSGILLVKKGNEIILSSNNRS